MQNSVNLMGRLTHDPEMRKTGSGKSVANFSLAVERDIASAVTGKRETDFIDCVAWDKTAEFICQWFSKGSMAVVTGRLQVRNWEDKNGNKRKTVEVNVASCYFGSSKKDTASPAAAPVAVPADDFAEITDDELPDFPF